MSKISYYISEISKIPILKEKYKENTSWVERRFLESDYISDKTKLSKMPKNERKIVKGILDADENYEKYVKSKNKEQEEAYLLYKETSMMGGKRTKRNKRRIGKKSLKVKRMKMNNEKEFIKNR